MDWNVSILSDIEIIDDFQSIGGYHQSRTTKNGGVIGKMRKWRQLNNN